MLNKIFSIKKDTRRLHIRFLGLKLSFNKDHFTKIVEEPCDIGIISFNINTNMSNFGAALHSYAFQKYLEKIGIDSVIVNYSRDRYIWDTYKSKISSCFTKENLAELRTYVDIFNSCLIKQRKFNEFFLKNCKITKNLYTPKTLHKLKNINRFICETDVTWTLFKGEFDRSFMCDYPNMKYKDNIAYSVDFGSKDFSSKNKKKLKKYAKNFKYISIRNVFKLDYIKNITKRDDIKITIDPVFLLDKNDYLKITQKPDIKEEYLLVYNCKENHPLMVEKAKQYAQENNLKLIIIHCYDKNITVLDKNNPTPIGIEEFLGYVANSKCLFTNSYHGLCFSIIYKVPFFAFSRTANNEKILTILELFNLHHRFVNNAIPKSNIDWNEVDCQLEKWKKTSIEFIHKSIINKTAQTQSLQREREREREREKERERE